MPDKVKTARLCILVQSWIYVALAAIILFLFIAGGAMIGISGESGSTIGGLLFGVFGLIFALLVGLSAVIGFITAKGISGKKNWAKIVGIILAILNLSNFPIGTILGVLILIGLFDSESASWFES